MRQDVPANLEARLRRPVLQVSGLVRVGGAGSLRHPGGFAPISRAAHREVGMGVAS
jgi:hypothetical protein